MPRCPRIACYAREHRRHFVVTFHCSSSGSLTVTSLFVCHHFRTQCFIVVDMGRLSSRHAEYVFQALRCSDKTSSVFSTLSGEQAAKVHAAQLYNEVSSGMQLPDAKRGAPRGAASAYVPQVCASGYVSAGMCCYTSQTIIGHIHMVAYGGALGLLIHLMYGT